MKKLICAVLAFAIFGSFKSKADEGMWIPLLLKKYNYEKMKQLGLKLTPEQLYDVNNSSLKDAIVWFNGGCTGEIISDKGLILTNHHCGYSAITSKSTPEDNILDNGFWAKNISEEKAIPGMWISIVQSIEDVSDRILNEVAGLDEKSRADSLSKIYKRIITEKTKGTHYEGQIREMFRGNAYYLFLFEKFTDIRLVGTPPQSIGKFGGDPDNWMWPRHTGDFSMFRAYANKDNKPAAYSTENVPYKPKHSLPVSIKGIKEGDFAMIMGFPGRTNRYEFSQGINLATEKVNPTIVALRDIRLKAWKEVMEKSEKDRLLLSDNYASVANYWKYFIGQTEQLKHLKVFEQKQAAEKKFASFANGKSEYETVLTNIDNAYNAYLPYSLQRTYLGEGILAVAMNSIAMSMFPYEAALNNEKGVDTSSANKAIANAKKSLDGYYSEFFPQADEKILWQVLYMYYKNIPADQYPAVMNNVILKSKGKDDEEKFKAYAKMVYAKSIFSSQEKYAAFLNKPNLKKLQNDPGFMLVKSFYDNYIKNFKSKSDDFNMALNKEGRKYIKGLMAMDPTVTFYPDANSSLRLTYGSVRSYEPKDAVKYEFQTTLEGVMEKYNPKDFEFNVPSRLIELYNKKDFGRYAMPNGKLPVAFITNNDITGGNSGSPVINGEGQIIGLAFDGNWEAMSGDIAYDDKYKRTINVDIRYVMFLIDKYGGASNIISELKIVE